MSKKIKILISITILIIIIPALCITGINIHMVNYSSLYMAENSAELENMIEGETDAVIILGAYVFENDQPCPILADRLDAGIEVYISGTAENILLSGDHGTRGYDEVNSMKTYTLGKGLDKEDVFLDHAGFSTYDSIVRADKIFGIDKVVISTQEYHLYRAIYIARKTGLEAYGIKADLREYPKKEMMKYLVREWFARVKDFIFIHILKPNPVYLGDEIPISGSSMDTYD